MIKIMKCVMIIEKYRFFELSRFMVIIMIATEMVMVLIIR